MGLMDLNSQSNPYDHVPHHGKKFIEDNTQYYWSFTSARVGTRYRNMETGFCPKGKPVEQAPVPAPAGRYFEGLPMFTIQVSGFYYRIPVDVTAVEERQTPVGRIVKWRNNLPFSPEQVQAATYKEGRDVIGDYMSAAEIADLT